MVLQIVHHPDYDAKFPAHHRFPMGKYRLLMETLRERGLANPGNLHAPAAASDGWLKLAHQAAYVDQVISLAVPRPVERDIGFAVDERVSRRARLASAACG